MLTFVSAKARHPPSEATCRLSLIAGGTPVVPRLGVTSSTELTNCEQRRLGIAARTVNGVHRGWDGWPTGCTMPSIPNPDRLTVRRPIETVSLERRAA